MEAPESNQARVRRLLAASMYTRLQARAECRASWPRPAPPGRRDCVLPTRRSAGAAGLGRRADQVVALIGRIMSDCVECGVAA